MLVVITMAAAGLLGGITNGFEAKEEGKKAWFFTKSILWGVCASFSIPLFLNIISSNLVERALFGSTELFIFFSFCLIASLFSKKFIQSLSDRLLNEIKNKQEQAEEEVENLKENIEPLVSKETEPDKTEEEGETKTKAFSFMLDLKPNSDSDTKKVMKALGRGKYVWRTPKGLAKETKVDPKEVSKILESLASKKMAVARKDKNRWGLTSKGRGAL